MEEDDDHVVHNNALNCDRYTLQYDLAYVHDDKSNSYSIDDDSYDVGLSLDDVHVMNDDVVHTLDHVGSNDEVVDHDCNDLIHLAQDNALGIDDNHSAVVDDSLIKG